jgi:hypothetical protein
MLEHTGMVAQSVTPDISQEFGFGRLFWPAAAFSAENVLSVFSNTPGGPFRPAALHRTKIPRPKRPVSFEGYNRPIRGTHEPEVMTAWPKPCKITGVIMR